MFAATALLRFGAVGALAIGYIFLSHYTLTTAGNETLGTLVAIAPIFLAAVSLAWNSRYRFPVLAFMLSVATVVTNWQEAIGLHYSTLYWVEHAGTQLLLCLMFGRTLQPGREPLCTVFARMVHGTMTPALARYTRQITLAWTMFFAVMAALSTGIFFAMPIRTWSIFANFFTAPLTCCMFIAEYAIRRTRNLDTEQVSIFAAVRAFWKMPESQ
ncbi:MAG: hypothetical protein V4695_03240 [Pseudomonadota bacterium]